MVSRRDFLKMAGLGAGAVFLNSCTPRLSPTPADAPLPGMPSVAATPTRTATPRIVSPTPEATGTGTFAPGPTPGPTVSYVGRKLCFVLWDHQLARYGFVPRNRDHPVPETCPLYSGAANTVTEPWSEYWRELLRLCNPGMSDFDFESGWKGLVDSARAFTNGTGPNSGHFALHSITCGGATHEMVTGIPERNGRYMRIYTLNAQRYPPPVPATPEEIDMTRHFFATTGSNVKLPDGTYVVNGFPQFENCIVPLVSPSSSDLIELSRIKVVTSMQRPYNP